MITSVLPAGKPGIGTFSILYLRPSIGSGVIVPSFGVVQVAVKFVVSGTIPQANTAEASSVKPSDGMVVEGGLATTNDSGIRIKQLKVSMLNCMTLWPATQLDAGEIYISRLKTLPTTSDLVSVGGLCCNELTAGAGSDYCQKNRELEHSPHHRHCLY